MVAGRERRPQARPPAGGQLWERQASRGGRSSPHVSTGWPFQASGESEPPRGAGSPGDQPRAVPSAELRGARPPVSRARRSRCRPPGRCCAGTEPVGASGRTAALRWREAGYPSPPCPSLSQRRMLLPRRQPGAMSVRNLNPGNVMRHRGICAGGEPSGSTGVGHAADGAWKKDNASGRRAVGQAERCWWIRTRRGGLMGVARRQSRLECRQR